MLFCYCITSVLSCLVLSCAWLCLLSVLVLFCRLHFPGFILYLPSSKTNAVPECAERDYPLELLFCLVLTVSLQSCTALPSQLSNPPSSWDGHSGSSLSLPVMVLCTCLLFGLLSPSLPQSLVVSAVLSINPLTLFLHLSPLSEIPDTSSISFKVIEASP